MSRSSYTLIESEHFKLPLSSLDIGLLYLETIVQINQTGYACNLQPSAFQVWIEFGERIQQILERSSRMIGPLFFASSR